MPILHIKYKRILANIDRLLSFFKQEQVRPIFVLKLLQNEASLKKTILNYLASLNYFQVADSIINQEKDPRFIYQQLRLSSLNCCLDTVKYADISFESQKDSLICLNQKAKQINKIHAVMLLYDADELREGIVQENLLDLATFTLGLKNLKLRGFVTNFACFSKKQPSNLSMQTHINFIKTIKARLNLANLIYSIGNSSSLNWLLKNQAKLSNLEIRLGEAFLMGLDPVSQKPIKGLNFDNFLLEVEVLESYFKQGKKRLLVDIGKQDCLTEGLLASKDLEIIGSSSDYLIIVDKYNKYRFGDKLLLKPDYYSLIGLLSSKRLIKVFDP